MTIIREYDLERFDFPSIVREMLEVGNLERLKAGCGSEDGWSIYKAMEAAPLYSTLVKCLTGERGADFLALYRQFVSECIAPLFEAPLCFQACPTVRLLFEDIKGESRFHRDADYGHDPREINFSVPLTPMFASNAIWIESGGESEDMVPIEIGPGEYVQFDGATRLHGAVPNTTGRSRVSFDFRVVREADLADQRIVTTDDPVVIDAHTFARSVPR